MSILSIFILFFTSCEKNIEESDRPNSSFNSSLPSSNNFEKISHPDQIGYKGLVQNSTGETLCVCTGYELLLDENWEYACKSGQGCTKIGGCPCPAGATGSSNVLYSDYEAFKNALDSNEIDEYFTGGGTWQNLFPELADQAYANVLTELQTGVNTALESVLENDDHMIVIVPASIGSGYELSDVLHTTLLSAEVFE